jgi:hypothetical protein
VLVAVTQNGDWVLGVSGRFDTPRLYKALSQEWTESGECTPVGDKTLQCARGAVQKTDDGALLLGTSLSAIQDAAGTSARGLALGLRETSAFTWGVALDELSVEHTSAASRVLLAAGVTRFSGTLEPENPLRGELWLESKQGDISEPALPLLKNAVSLLPPAARQIGIEALRDAALGAGKAPAKTAPGEVTPIETSFPRSLLMESFERFVGWFSLAYPAAP